MSRGLFALTLSLSLGAFASAAPTLFSSGLTPDGLSILAPGALDSHWTADGGSAFRNNSDYPTWETSGPSGWITSASQDSNSDTAGLHSYATSFDLTGFDPSTLIIKGKFTADDDIIGIFVNGGLVPGTSYDSSLAPWERFYEFNVSSSNAVIGAGVNVFEIRTNSDDAFYEGVNVQFGDISATPVPEPASMAVLGLGLAALKRRRKSA